jgi:SPP1 family predicted phage head-tail adaptor
VTEGTTWAEVLPLRIPAREFFAAGQTQHETSLKFHIRRWDAVNSTWRITWNGQNYDITSVVRLGTTFTEIMAMQGVKDGR